MQLRHDLPISVNNRVILPFREGFIFTKAKFPEDKTLAKISKFTVKLGVNFKCDLLLLIFDGAFKSEVKE